MSNQFKPQRGERVRVWERNPEQCQRLLFVTEIKGAMFPYIVVTKGSEHSFKAGERFLTTRYSHIGEIEKG